MSPCFNASAPCYRVITELIRRYAACYFSATVNVRFG